MFHSSSMKHIFNKCMCIKLVHMYTRACIWKTLTTRRTKRHFPPNHGQIKSIPEIVAITPSSWSPGAGCWLLEASWAVGNWGFWGGVFLRIISCLGFTSKNTPKKLDGWSTKYGPKSVVFLVPCVVSPSPAPGRETYTSARACWVCRDLQGMTRPPRRIF